MDYKLAYLNTLLLLHSAQYGKDDGKRGGWRQCIKVMEITLLIMEKSWNGVFKFLLEPCSMCIL